MRRIEYTYRLVERLLVGHVWRGCFGRVRLMFACEILSIDERVQMMFCPKQNGGCLCVSKILLEWKLDY